jgi:hypothetical protein
MKYTKKQVLDAVAELTGKFEDSEKQNLICIVENKDGSVDQLLHASDKFKAAIMFQLVESILDGCDSMPKAMCGGLLMANISDFIEQKLKGE